MKNKRRFSRIQFEYDSVLVVDQQRFPTQIADISLKGALVNKPDDWTVKIGASAVLEMRLLGSDILLRMQLEIAHEKDDRLGIRFVSIDLESISHLRRLMELNLGDSELIERELTALG